MELTAVSTVHMMERQSVHMMERQSKGRRHGTSIRKKRTSKNNGLATVQEQVQEEGADGVCLV